MCSGDEAPHSVPGPAMLKKWNNGETAKSLVFWLCGYTIRNYHKLGKEGLESKIGIWKMVFELLLMDFIIGSGYQNAKPS